MSKVQITAVLNTDDDEADSDDPTGLTSDAFDHYMDALQELGFDEIDFKAKP